MPGNVAITQVSLLPVFCLLCKNTVTMAHKTLAIVAILSLIGMGFLIYLAMTFEPPESTRTVELDTPIPRPVEAPVEIAPAQEEVEESRPVQQVPAPSANNQVVTEQQSGAENMPAPEVELPALNQSDTMLFNRLAEMELGASLLRLLAPDDVIRKFVVFVHNAAQGELPQLEYPLRRIPGEFEVNEVDDNFYELAPANYQRYEPMISTVTDMEPAAVMSLYRQMKPLFQEAYAEIGYQEDFDQVALRAIDQIMSFEPDSGPYQLIKPSVQYIYAENRYESLPPVQKQLIRIGPENLQRLKQRLPAYRERLQAD